MYLTRDQAIATLIDTGSTDESANAILDNALRLYPQSHRTTFDMVTGYPARVWNPPYSQVDRFTIGPW